MIWPDWSGETAVVLGSGASARSVAEALPLERFKVAVTNLSFRLYPQADILYAADSGFWQVYRDARKFGGIKASAHDMSHKYVPDVVTVQIPKDQWGRRYENMIRRPVGHVGNGLGNSGFQLVNLVAQLGPARILLGGLDYCGDHWHGSHPPSLRNPSEGQLIKWSKKLDEQATRLAKWGIEVFNLSDNSRLENYERVPRSRFTT